MFSLPDQFVFLTVVPIRKMKSKCIVLGHDNRIFFPPVGAVKSLAVPRQSWHLVFLSVFSSDPDQSQSKDGKAQT